jgi:hypothetical protein
MHAGACASVEPQHLDNSEFLLLPAGHEVLVGVKELCDGSHKARMHSIHLFLAGVILLHHCIWPTHSSKSETGLQGSAL